MKRIGITVLTACAIVASAPALACDCNNGGHRSDYYHSDYYYGSVSEHDYNHSAVRLSRQEVSDVQYALNRAGYNAGQEDGVLGKRTRAAVKSFQYDRRIPGEGKVTPRTLRALKGHRWGDGWIRGNNYDHRLNRNYN